MKHKSIAIKTILIIFLLNMFLSACTFEGNNITRVQAKKLLNQAKELRAKLEMIELNNSWSQQFDDILKTNYRMRFDISPKGDISEMNSYEAIKLLKQIEPDKLKIIEAKQYVKRTRNEPIGIKLNAYSISGEYTDLDTDQILDKKSGSPFTIAYLFDEKEVLYQMGLFYENDSEWSTFILLKLLS